MRTVSHVLVQPCSTSSTLPSASGFLAFLPPSPLALPPGLSPAPPLRQRLVRPLERRDGLALVLVERGADDGAVAEVDLAVRLLLPGEGVLHPVLVVAVGVILAGVGATGLLA